MNKKDVAARLERAENEIKDLNFRLNLQNAVPGETEIKDLFKGGAASKEGVFVIAFLAAGKFLYVCNPDLNINCPRGACYFTTKDKNAQAFTFEQIEKLLGKKIGDECAVIMSKAAAMDTAKEVADNINKELDRMINGGE